MFSRSHVYRFSSLSAQLYVSFFLSYLHTHPLTSLIIHSYHPIMQRQVLSGEEVSQQDHKEGGKWFIHERVD